MGVPNHFFDSLADPSITSRTPGARGSIEATWLARLKAINKLLISAPSFTPTFTRAQPLMVTPHRSPTPTRPSQTMLLTFPVESWNQIVVLRRARACSRRGRRARVGGPKGEGSGGERARESEAVSQTTVSPVA